MLEINPNFVFVLSCKSLICFLICIIKEELEKVDGAEIEEEEGGKGETVELPEWVEKLFDKNSCDKFDSIIKPSGIFNFASLKKKNWKKVRKWKKKQLKREKRRIKRERETESSQEDEFL